MMTRETSSSTAIAANRLRKAKLGGGLVGPGQNIPTVHQENFKAIVPDERQEEDN
jgi:hypothetical protein